MEEIQFSIIEYLKYIEGHERSRCVYEGEEVYNAGHLILCGMSERGEKFIKICALCLQTSSLQSPPHKIQGEFIINNSRAYVKNVMCSCKAGNSGRCKHISAALIFCTRISLDKLEYISQTDLKCTWSEQKIATKEKYKPVPIDQIPCFSESTSKSFKIDATDEKLRQISLNMVQFLPHSAVAMHSTGRSINSNIRDNNRPIVGDDELQSIKIILNTACQSTLMMELESLKINFVCRTCNLFFNQMFSKHSDDIALNTKFDKNNWHAERKYRVTGSRIYEIFTYRGQDWIKKSQKFFSYNFISNKFVNHGLEQEKFARDHFVKMTRFEVVEVGLIVSEANSWIGFSPDGIILRNGKPYALLEIKCPYMGKSDTLQNTISSLKYVEFKNGIYCLKEKHKYYAQVQMGMALLNLNTCYFTIYCSFDQSMVILEIELD